MNKLTASLVVSSLFVASISTVAQAAHPQNHTTKKGELIVSGERLFGFHYFSSEMQPPNGGQKSTTSGSMVNFLWGSNASGTAIPNFYATPRLGFDYAIFDGFTVGGTFGVMTSSSKEEANGRTENGPSNTVVAVSTRLGYCFAFGKHGLWLRGGSSYFSASQEQTQNGATNKVSITGLALTTEALFVFGATDTVSFTAGLTTDYGVSGAVEAGGNKTDFKLLNVGLPLGMVAHF